MSQRLRTLSKEELIQKVLESEAILNEFQESSKDLEKALEDELQELETAKLNLEHQVINLKNQLIASKQQNLEQGKELDSLQDLLLSKDQEIINLQQKIVKIEIANASMESQDRIMLNKYQVQQSFNNELLEKLAILEDELDRTKKENAERQLHITNYKIQIKDLQDKIKNAEPDENAADVSFVSLLDVLKSTPPPNVLRDVTNTSQSKMKKSDSLQKLKNLTRDIDIFLGKKHHLDDSPIEKSKRLSILKAPSSTKLTISDQSVQIDTDRKTKRLSYSKRYSQLPSISGSPRTIDRHF
ncbi:NDE1 [Candida metapsilosis]|uniref:NDE1 n=1 Tax=Candida metapsilosis TaxID=273372 RepID=A0A8H7ZKX7_9ASCO|nr:NDE1 [Candida metapsilosis]